MISTELANLSDYLLGHASKQLNLAPSAAIHLANVLLDLSRQARQLERLPVDDTSLVYAEDRDGG